MTPERSIEDGSQKGAVAILSAISLVVMIGFAAMVLDIGQGLLTRIELQNASDAGTLAGTRELAMVYKDLGSGTSYKDYTLSSSDKARIQAKVAALATANAAAGVAVSVLESDTTYGVYDNDSGHVTAQDKGVRAIELKARRDDQANGQLPTTAARVLGIDTMSVRATTAASLSPLGSLPEGYGEVPVGISSHWFEEHSCETDPSIKFFPTGSMEGCAGWHTFTEWPASAARLGDILGGLEDGSYSSPATVADQTYYNFTGGTVGSRFDDMKELYDAKKDADGNWMVTVPVYQDDDCSNPNGSTLIVGFAKARIYSVIGPPTMTISAEVQCGITDVGSGGGSEDYGTLYGLPSIVE